MNFSIVTSCYNNSKQIKKFCKKIFERFNEKKIEIIIVNDGSTDNTWDVIKELTKNSKYIKGINLKNNLGQHRAMYIGYGLAKNEFIVSMDCDLQDDVNLLNKLTAKLSKNEITFVKYKYNFNKKNIMLTKLYWFLFTLISLTKLELGTSNYFIAHKKFIKKLLKNGLIVFSYADFKFLKCNIKEIIHKKIIKKNYYSSYNFKRRVSLALNNILKYNILTIVIMRYFKLNIFYKKIDKNIICEKINL